MSVSLKLGLPLSPTGYHLVAGFACLPVQRVRVLLVPMVG